MTDVRTYARWVCALGCLVLAASCGASQTQPKKFDFGERPMRDTWANTSWADRHTLMTFTVLPNMGRYWQEFTKSDAPTLTCRTCHGADAEDAKYAMPNPALPKLDPQHLPDASSKDRHQAEWATFMRRDVVPWMTFLIGAERYDAKTGRGFWCFNCHIEKGP